MARQCANSTHLMDFTGYPSGWWTWGSWFMAIDINGGSGYRYMGTSTENHLFGLTDTDVLNSSFVPVGFSALASPTVNTTDGWRIIAFTKDTGTVVSRFHIYTWATNTWVHANGGETCPNANATTDFRVFNDASGEAIFCNLAAVGLIHGRVMTDSEMEKLPRGRWDMLGQGYPSFLAEFPSGRDQIVTSTVARHRDLGRYRGTTSTVTGTVRADVKDPPGFRFSPLNRRR